MKKNFLVLFSFVLIFSIVLGGFSGCSKQKGNSSKDENKLVYVESLNVKDMFSKKDVSSDLMLFDDVININLNDSTVTSDSKKVRISKSNITIKDAGTYMINGSLTDGQIIVNADKSEKVQLILNNASITSSSSSPIYVKQADKVFITLNKDTSNTLTASGEFIKIDDNNIDAAIFSKDDITVNGTGSLNISSVYGHGIVSKDDLVVSGGNLSINSAEHGLSGKQSVRIANGNFNIVSGKDGIHAENKDNVSSGYIYIKNGIFNINSKGDGIDSGNILQIDNGTFNIISGGGSKISTIHPDNNHNLLYSFSSTSSSDKKKPAMSVKGIKSNWNLIINGGNFSIDSYDDAIHSNINLYINGGDFKISSGDDALHADLINSVLVNSLYVDKCYEGIEGQEVEVKGGNITITSDDDSINAAENKRSTDNPDTADTFDQIRTKYYSNLSCSIKISNGILTLNPSDDGLDSSRALYVTGGEIYINAPISSKSSAIDSGNIAKITGGKLIGSGGGRMAENFKEDSSQCAVLYSFKDIQNAGTEITVKDSNGKKLISFAPSVNYQTINISIPEFKVGKSYTISTKGSSEKITISSTSETIGRDRVKGN